MSDAKGDLNFEADVLPNLDPAYNLARWLTRNQQDAQDVVQESLMRAFRFFSGCRGDNTRAWLLGIVRNTCYTWLKQNRPADTVRLIDEELQAVVCGASGPDAQASGQERRQLLHQAIDDLPAEYREVIVLARQEELSHAKIIRYAFRDKGRLIDSPEHPAFLRWAARDHDDDKPRK